MAKLTAKQWNARAQAYTEVANLLGDLDWTDNKAEREQGYVLAEYFRRRADKCFDRANDLEQMEKKNK